MKNSHRQTKKALLKDARLPAALTADTFQNAAARLGYGAGNLTDASHYNIDYLSRNRQRLDAMYRSSWICGKAVDTVAEDMTKRGIELHSDMEPSEEATLEQFWKGLQIWERLADAIRWARLYGGAIAVLLIDGQQLDTPLNPESIGKDQFKGLCVLDRWMAIPDLSRLIADLGPDLGKPMFYDVTGGSMMPLSGRIHYSRVIRLEGQELPYWQRIAEMLWGQSVLERIWDRVLAFDSTTQGAAQLVYKAHLRTIRMKDLRTNIGMGGKQLEGLLKQIDFIRQTQSNEGLTLLDAEDEFEAHQYTFGGLDTVLLQFGQQLSGAMNIPLTRLFGQSPAGLNSTGESDLRTYYDGINQEQESDLRGGIQVLLQVSHLSQFGKPLPEDATFTFRPLWLPTETEKAAIAGQVTTAVTAAQTSGIIGQKTALKELKQSSRLTGVFTNIDDATIEAASDDTDPLGELSGGSDPFGDKADGPGKTKDGWKESEHPRDPNNGEFSEGGGSARESGLHPDIAPYFQHTNEALKGKPKEALAWVRGGRNRFVSGAIAHPAFESGIGLLHGEPGDANNDWRGGFGVSHVDAKRPGYLDDAIRTLPSLPLSERESGPGRKILTDGRNRAVVSLGLRGHTTPAWLLTSYSTEKA